jgi:hypothetical protein
MRVLHIAFFALVAACVTANSSYQQALYGHVPLYGQQSTYWSGSSVVAPNSALIGPEPNMAPIATSTGEPNNGISIEANVPSTSPGPSGSAPSVHSAPAPAPAPERKELSSDKSGGDRKDFVRYTTRRLARWSSAFVRTSLSRLLCGAWWTARLAHDQARGWSGRRSEAGPQQGDRQMVRSRALEERSDRRKELHLQRRIGSKLRGCRLMSRGSSRLQALTRPFAL